MKQRLTIDIESDRPWSNGELAALKERIEYVLLEDYGSVPDGRMDGYAGPFITSVEVTE